MTRRPDGTVVYTPFPNYEREVTDGGAVTERATYTIAGQMVAVRAAGVLYYTYTDHLGNVVLLSKTNGSIVSGSNARYDPFGNYRTWPGSNVNPTISDRGFTGHIHDNTGDYPTQNVGLIYMNARYYLPEVGRFISPDSIVPEAENPQSYNRYSYVRNSPMNFIDPTGHSECNLQQTCTPNVNNGSSSQLEPIPVDNPFVVATPRVTEAFPLPSTGPLTEWLVNVLVAYANSDQVNRMAITWQRGKFYSTLPFLPAVGMPMMAEVLQEWTRHVWTGAVWDFKPDILLLPGLLREGYLIELGGMDDLSFEAVANIFYGFIGRQIGMGEILLQGGAGAAQATWGFDHWYGNLSDYPLGFGDQAFDAWSIHFGFALYDQFGSNVDALTVQSFTSSLASYRALNPMPALP